MKLGSPYWTYTAFFCTCSIYIQLSCDFFSLSYVKVQYVWLDYVKFVCGLMAISHRPSPSAATAILIVHCRPPLPSSSFAIVVRRPPSLFAAHRRPPRHPLPSESSAAIVIRRRRHHLSRSFIVSRGLKISSNICLGPLAPPFHFFTQSTGTQSQGYPFSSDQSHANILVGSRP